MVENLKKLAKQKPEPEKPESEAVGLAALFLLSSACVSTSEDSLQSTFLVGASEDLDALVQRLALAA